MPHPQAPEKPRTTRGGLYTALEQPDGLWTIQNVEVFATLPAGAKKNRQEIGREWMEAALERNRLRDSEGHLPPVHVNHHDFGQTTRRIGLLKLTRVGECRMAGRSVDCLFADIVDVKPEDFDLIREFGLPYRSVEVANWHDPEIGSFALMEDESPFFKFPMLSIGAEIRQHSTVDVYTEDEAPAVAHAHMRDRELILFSFRGSTMAPKKTPAQPKPQKFSDEDRKKISEILGKEVSKKFADEVLAKLQDEENGNGNGEDDEKMQDGAAAAVAKALEDFQKKLPEAIESILQRVLEGLIPGGGSTDTAPAEQTAAGAFSDSAQEGEGDDAGEDQVAKLSGRLAGLEKWKRDQETTQTIEKAVDASVAKLKEEGYELDEGTVSQMRELAEGAKDPAKSLEKFSETYRAVAQKDPPQKLSDVGGAGEGAPEDPEEVLKFRQKGPEALKRARELRREYQALKDGGFPLQSTLEEYLEHNFELEEAGRL